MLLLAPIAKDWQHLVPASVDGKESFQAKRKPVSQLHVVLEAHRVGIATLRCHIRRRKRNACGVSNQRVHHNSKNGNKIHKNNTNVE
jgi:hypothetical protein